MTKKFKRPFQHYNLVEVIWDDAAGIKDGWTAKHEKVEPYIALSVGFLIKDEGDHILIAQDTDGDGQHNGRTQIPRGMVKKIKILRKKDAPKKEKLTIEPGVVNSSGGLE
jgi:hypothetical protein